MQKRIFTDFDGTITLKDTCDAMLDEFGDKEWRRIDQLWVEGKISTEEAARILLRPVKASREQIKEFIYSLEIDPSFIEFTRFCFQKNWLIVILSDGYDFFIETILKKYELSHIPYYSNQLIFGQNGLDIACPYAHAEYPMQGVAKAKILRSLLPEGYQSVYIGDGISDIHPAELADLLFAKKSLEKYCVQKKLPYHPFDTFQDVMDFLDL